MPAAPPHPRPVGRPRDAAASPAEGHRFLPFDAPALDRPLGGGLRAGALHDVSAASGFPTDDAAATGFLAGIAARAASEAGAPVLWIGARTDLYAPGLAQAGLASGGVIHVRPRDDADALAVAEDGLHDGSPCAVVVEASRASMIATRRLQLAAADAGMPVLLFRRRRGHGDDPLAEPSAAWTRWRVGSAPSGRPFVTGAPLSGVPLSSSAVASMGRPRWSVELVRQRGGEPFSLILEGCDATGRLAVPALPVRGTDQAAGAVRAAAA